MKSALLLTLVASLVASAFPLLAQEQTPKSFNAGVVAAATSTTHPFARALLKTARPVVVGGNLPSSGLELVAKDDDPDRSDWSRVVTLASDAELLVIVRGSKPAHYTFAQADEATLIVRTGRWQTIQRIARGDVDEIRTGPSRKRRALGLLAGFGGAMGGAAIGVAVGSLGGDAEDLRGSSLMGMAGVVGGAMLGYRAVTHTKGELIYRQP